MLIDCDSCANRGAGCSGCLVTALLDTETPAARLDAAEHRAIEVFALAGFEVDVLARTSGRAARRRPARRGRAA